MAEIEIRPEEAAAAAKQMVSAAEGIDGEMFRFTQAIEFIASGARNAMIRAALAEVAGPLAGVPSGVSATLRRVGEAGTAAAAGMVAVDRNGALTFRSPGSTAVMS